MNRRNYNIVMRTSIGDRSGRMEMRIENRKITGRLHALNRSEPFEGVLDENGNCRIRGCLVTLLSTIPYTANGQMTLDSLNLMLESEQTSFPIIGAASGEFTTERNDHIDA